MSKPVLLPVLAVLTAISAAPVTGEVQLVRGADGRPTLTNTPGSRYVVSKSVLRRAEDYATTIAEFADRESLPAELVRAVILVESAFNPMAVSSKGAMGLMQLMPATAAELRVRDPHDPRQNIDGGTRYLRRMLDEFDGRLPFALAAYNAGPNAVHRYNGIPPYDETRNYVRRVMRVYQGVEPDLPAASPTRVSAARRGRPSFLRRGADGRLLLTTDRPSGR